MLLILEHFESVLDWIDEPEMTYSFVAVNSSFMYSIDARRAGRGDLARPVGRQRKIRHVGYQSGHALPAPPGEIENQDILPEVQLSSNTMIHPPGPPRPRLKGGPNSSLNAVVAAACGFAGLGDSTSSPSTISAKQLAGAARMSS